MFGKIIFAFISSITTPSVLPKDVSAEHSAFYNTICRAAEQGKSDREADAIAATNGALGLAVGQLYTQKYFPPEAKAKAQAMVRDLLAAYRERIPKLTWMSPETKQKALAKLAALQVIVGYPDEWIDYSSLEIVRGDALRKYAPRRIIQSFARPAPPATARESRSTGRSIRSSPAP